jgi:hypothetical protein
MIQSLNISVACAVTLYEAFRQRRKSPWTYFFHSLSFLNESGV